MLENLKVIFGVALVLSVPLIIIIEAITEKLRLDKKNREWIKENGKKLRKLCINCPYCKWTIYLPFHNSHELASKSPRYCRKFRCKLSGDSMYMCCAKDASKAIWEDD